MPTYEFKCKHCGNVFEKSLKFSDPHPTLCPVVIEISGDHGRKTVTTCGGPLQQVYYPVGIKYKAGGFSVNTSDWMDEDVEGTPYDY